MLEIFSPGCIKSSGATENNQRHVSALFSAWKHYLMWATKQPHEMEALAPSYWWGNTKRRNFRTSFLVRWPVSVEAGLQQRGLPSKRLLCGPYNYSTEYYRWKMVSDGMAHNWWPINHKVKMKIKKNTNARGCSGSPVVRTLHFDCQGHRFNSLVRELGSSKLCGATNNNNSNNNKYKFQTSSLD